MKTLITLLLALSVTPLATATEIVIDYTFAGDFFDPATEDGQKARQTVEAAAGFYSAILEDSLPAIQTPDPYVGATNGTTTTFTWDAIFRHPSAPGELTVTGPTLAEDEFRVYVGAQPLPGMTSGEAGAGGYNLSSESVGPGYPPAELSEVRQTGGLFEDLLMFRGQGANDFATWGGSVTFDSEMTWNLDHTVSPMVGQNDLYSVALHEIAHTLGVGGSDEWRAFVSPAFFLGEQATAANGGTSPGLDATGAHFAEGTQSTVYGGTAPQEASLDPTLTLGTRKLLTELDVAALRDIGWSIAPSVIPEPAALSLGVLALWLTGSRRRR